MWGKKNFKNKRKEEEDFNDEKNHRDIHPGVYSIEHFVHVKIN